MPRWQGRAGGSDARDVVTPVAGATACDVVRDVESGRELDGVQGQVPDKVQGQVLDWEAAAPFAAPTTSDRFHEDAGIPVANASGRERLVLYDRYP